MIGLLSGQQYRNELQDSCAISQGTWYIQVQFLLDAAANSNSAELAVVSVQPSPICGNGICEIGERPGGNSTASLRTGAAMHSHALCSSASSSACKMMILHRPLRQSPIKVLGAFMETGNFAEDTCMHSHHAAGLADLMILVPHCRDVCICRLPPGLPSGHGALPRTDWISGDVRGRSAGRLRHCQRRLHVQPGLRRLRLRRLHAGVLPAGLALLAYRCR